VDYARSGWKEEEHAYRARCGKHGQGCSHGSHRFPLAQPSPPRWFHPSAPSDNDGGEYDEFEDIYYRARHEYD
jgi:hypothetical protein